MSYDFSGKRALVTGAGQGMGRATALSLVQQGAHVIALDVNGKHLDSLKSENPAIETVCVDLSDWNSTREAVKKVTPVHLLVNNAAIAVIESVLETKPESFDSQFNVNVKAILNVTQVVAGDLIDRKIKGTVVNTSSKSGQRAFKDHIIYCATKAAVDSFTRSMALELSPKGIRVNAVSPTVVMTEMGKKAWSEKEKSDPILARIPQGRFAEESDVVNAILYLLSDRSDMVNGHSLAVDGGYLAV